jgi:hypothetical protein
MSVQQPASFPDLDGDAAVMLPAQFLGFGLGGATVRGLEGSAVDDLIPARQEVGSISPHTPPRRDCRHNRYYQRRFSRKPKKVNKS